MKRSRVATTGLCLILVLTGVLPTTGTSNGGDRARASRYCSTLCPHQSDCTFDRPADDD